MGLLRISYTVEGEKQVQSLIKFTGKDLSDYTEPLTNSNQLLLRAWDINFDKKGSELGSPWKKRKKSYSWPILQKTKAMRKGFKSELLGGINKTSSKLWNTVSYFPYHQSSAPRNKLPRRIMMKIDEKRATEIFREFTKYLDKVRNRWE